MKNAIVSGEHPRLETERLVLRQLSLDDVDAVFKHFSDGQVTAYIDIPSLKNPEQAEKVIMYMLGLFERGEGIRWAISKKEDDSFIGSCGFDRITHIRGSRGEVKYDLCPEHWGCGYMSEALREVVRYGFEKMELNRIEALVVEDATRSITLLERMGFKREGTLRGYSYWKGKYWDEISFSLLKDEWGGAGNG